ncbi:MAG: DUF5060 domain-containing protein [Puniceicoccaceae bacterium]|nr:MAG: DUF5060 domain-containing protein [Puniceicoccaceae bacterium]
MDTPTVECWGLHEIRLDGPKTDQAFRETPFTVAFRKAHREIVVDGFYDGGGTYRARFMPDAEGDWSWESRSSTPALEGQSGALSVTTPSSGNHGPVRVRSPHDLAYADGTWFSNLGTTCYVWNHQEDKRFNQTLQTLKTTPFNKLRFCLFPKHYRYNENEPPLYPFPLLKQGDSGWQGSYQGEQRRGWEFDLEVFVPEYFQRLDRAIAALRDLGIEADLILFHPYDRWGFSHLPAEIEDRLLRYVAARFAAYRNLWWSFANEWDLMDNKSENDWERHARVIQESDPYGHLRGIHNCRRNYDHSRPWVTHVSFQGDPGKVAKLREQFGKPVVVDECRYEGNIEEGWGNITGRGMVERFWNAVHQGGFCGHGETYYNDEEVLWWSKGGVLTGDSPERIAFLRSIVESDGGGVYHPTGHWHWRKRGENDREFLYWGGEAQSREISLQLPEGKAYRAEIIDAWEMTTQKLPGPFTGRVVIPLPARPHCAVRLLRID